MLRSPPPAPGATALARHGDSPVVTQERRLVYKLEEYWDRLRDGRKYPSLKDINEDSIFEMWPWCFIIKLKNTKDDFEIRYLGKNLSAFSLIFISGERDSLPNTTLLDRVLELVPEVIEAKKPIRLEEEIERFDHRRLAFRCGLFPLSSNQTHIDFIFGGANGILISEPGN